MGDVAARQSPIGNPKHEFLPANREQIAAELRGMVERWKAAGMPLDEGVKHPFGPWAKVVGGILQANQFSDFLANYGVRKMADDPVRRGLGLLGVDSPDMSLLEGNSPKNWKTASDWAQIALKLGLVKTVIPVADRDSKEGRARGSGPS